MVVVNTEAAIKRLMRFLAIEGGDDLPANFVSHYEHAKRHQIRVAEIPNFLLQRYACPHFFQAVTKADNDRIRREYHSRSCCFACCHNDSSSSMVLCSGPRPEARN